MNDLSKSLKILVDRYPGTMAELARQAQIDRSSLYKIMDGKRMPNRAQLQRLIHALGLSARQAEHLTTQYDELRSGAQAHRTDEALYELLQTAMRSRDNLMNDVLAPVLPGLPGGDTAAASAADPLPAQRRKAPTDAFPVCGGKRTQFDPHRCLFRRGFAKAGMASAAVCDQ